MKKFFIIIILSGIGYTSFGQNNLNADSIIDVPENSRKFDIGLGFGLDYGGLFGLKISGVPIDHLLVFGSGGYLPIGFGWNIGVAGNLYSKTSKRAVRPYIKAMYGTNSAIEVEGDSEYSEIFIGFTLGLGLEFRFGKYKNNGINFDINFPIIDEAYYDLLDEIKADPQIKVGSESSYVAVSIGYHIEF